MYFWLSYSIMAEFPDDVLSIIRAYAKPSFVWFKEYKAAHTLNLCADHLQKLRMKMDDPEVREHLKICVDAYATHKQSCVTLFQKRNPMNEERESKQDWWSLVCLDNLVALLEECESHEKTYAEWIFQDSDSDSEVE